MGPAAAERLHHGLCDQPGQQQPCRCASCRLTVLPGPVRAAFCVSMWTATICQNRSPGTSPAGSAVLTTGLCAQPYLTHTLAECLRASPYMPVKWPDLPSCRAEGTAAQLLGLLSGSPSCVATLWLATAHLVAWGSLPQQTQVRVSLLCMFVWILPVWPRLDGQVCCVSRIHTVRQHTRCSAALAAWQPCSWPERTWSPVAACHSRHRYMLFAVSSVNRTICSVAQLLAAC